MASTSSSSGLRRSVSFVLAAAALVAACVGDSATPGATDTDAGSGTGQDAATDGGTAAMTDSGGPSDAGQGTDTGTPSDGGSTQDSAVATDSGDAGLPTVTCASEAVGGAFFFTKLANKPAITPGGNIQLGDYKLTRYWDGAGGQISGSATVFQQNGQLFIQSYQLVANGTPKYSTKWIQTSGTNVTLTEMCDSATKGSVVTIPYEMRLTTNPTELYFDHTTYEEGYAHM